MAKLIYNSDKYDQYASPIEKIDNPKRPTDSPEKPDERPTKRQSTEVVTDEQPIDLTSTSSTSQLDLFLTVEQKKATEKGGPPNPLGSATLQVLASNHDIGRTSRYTLDFHLSRRHESTC